MTGTRLRPIDTNSLSIQCDKIGENPVADPPRRAQANLH